MWIYLCENQVFLPLLLRRGIHPCNELATGNDEHHARNFVVGNEECRKLAPNPEAIQASIEVIRLLLNTFDGIRINKNVACQIRDIISAGSILEEKDVDTLIKIGYINADVSPRSAIPELT
jgi:hypothetical protein